MKSDLLKILFAGAFLLILTLFINNALHTDTCNQNDMPTDAEGYLRYRKASRADAKGNIPMGALIRAKEHMARMNNSQRDAGLWEWDWLGPSNIGGRIRTILPDPNNANILWIGSVSGGIWKSTNRGSSWSPVDDFMSCLAITSMVFDPSSINIMYAATGEGFGNIDALPGAGIFKSTDGGSTWNQLATTNNADFKYVNRLAAHPNPDSAGVLFAVTSRVNSTGTNAIWKSNDGGLTWHFKLSRNSPIYQVIYDPNNHNELLVAGKGFLLLSYDYGESWENQAVGGTKLPFSNGRYEASFCPSNVNKLYVSIDISDGEVWCSTDNGATWSLRSTGVDYFNGQGWYNNCIWVSPNNSNRIIVGGLDLYRSTDGGSSLTQISNWRNYHNGGDANSAHCDQHCIVEAADWNITTNPEVYFGNDGGIQKTNNVWNVSDSTGWINMANTSLGISQFFGGAAAPDGSIIVGGSQDNDKLRYRKSGNWSGAGAWFQSTTGDGGNAAINYNNTNVIYGEYIYLSIRKSTDGGDTYFSASSGLSDAWNKFRSLFIAPFSMDPNDPSILVAGGSRIFRTTDDAGIWTQIRPDLGMNAGNLYYILCSSIDIAKNNSAIIWAGYDDGQLAYTNNTGTSWNRVDENGIGLPDRYLTDIAINPNNSNQVFVTFGGYESDNVWYTPDAGATWENRSGAVPNELPSLQVNTVRFHPVKSNWVYIGTDLGVFSSSDKGVNWSVITNPNYGGNGNNGPVNTEISELFWQGDEFLIAATHGRGMYRTAGPPLTIFVDQNASPGGNGNQAHPFKTIAEAAEVAGPGTTISIESGIYNESQIILLQNEGFIIITNGDVVIQ